MPITQCKACGYVVADPSRPCLSCGNKSDQSPKPSEQSDNRASEQPPGQSSSYGGGDDDASRFSIGAVLSFSFHTLFKHPIIFVGLSFLGVVPGQILAVLEIGNIVPLLAFGICGLTVQGAIVHGVHEVLQGNAVQFRKSLSRGTSRLGLQIILATLLTAGFSLGFLLLVIPGLLLMCIWAVAVPACVVERLGPKESLSRSFRLTEEYRRQILGIQLLCSVTISVLFYVFSSGLSAMVFMKFFGFILGLILFSTHIILFIAIPIAFFHVTTAVIYYYLREIKEGVDADQLSDVFD